MRCSCGYEGNYWHKHRETSLRWGHRPEDHIPLPPPPGSTDALDYGCTCPILDNNHGRYPPRPPNGWWISSGCPLHDTSQ